MPSAFFCFINYQLDDPVCSGGRVPSAVTHCAAIHFEVIRFAVTLDVVARTAATPNAATRIAATPSEVIRIAVIPSATGEIQNAVIQTEAQIVVLAAVNRCEVIPNAMDASRSVVIRVEAPVLAPTAVIHYAVIHCAAIHYAEIHYAVTHCAATRYVVQSVGIQNARVVPRDDVRRVRLVGVRVVAPAASRLVPSVVQFAAEVAQALSVVRVSVLRRARL